MQYIETACLRQRKPNSREADHKLKIICACHWIPGRVTFNNGHPAVHFLGMGQVRKGIYITLPGQPGDI